MQKFVFMLATVSMYTGTLWSQPSEDIRQLFYYHRFESAKNILKDMAEKPDTDPDSWYWLSEAYRALDHQDSARIVLNQGQEIFLQKSFTQKKYPLLWVGQARQALLEGRTLEARQQMEAILRETRFRNEPAILEIARAQVYSPKGDPSWVVDLLTNNIRRYRKHPLYFITLGDAYKKLRKGSEAVSSYQDALDADGHYAEALYKEALIYKGQQNKEVFLERLERAHALDSVFTPVIYELYTYYFFRDTEKTGRLLDAYLRHSDAAPEHAYMQADYCYITKQYDRALELAEAIVLRDQEDLKPRIHKLMAYAHAALGDTVQAAGDMSKYLKNQPADHIIARDYAFQAGLLSSLRSDDNLAAELYEKAINMEEDMEEKIAYMYSLADWFKQSGDRANEAVWRKNIYQSHKKPSNLDLFNWGLATYAAGNYQDADSVFAQYANAYPDHMHGYMMRAKCNALIDTSMEMGLALPHYKKLIEVASQDTKKNRKTLLQAYGYLGTYEANITKDYEAALGYFDRMLELEPENRDAEHYASILKKWIEDGQGSK